MSKMPLYFYLPRVKRFWNGKILQFTFLRDYGIQFDFRKGSFIDWMLTPKEKQTFYERFFMKRN
jgi:ferredoxin-NADP reductase